MSPLTGAVEVAAGAVGSTTTTTNAVIVGPMKPLNLLDTTSSGKAATEDILGVRARTSTLHIGGN